MIILKKNKNLFTTLVYVIHQHEIRSFWDNSPYHDSPKSIDQFQTVQHEEFLNCLVKRPNGT